MAKMFVHYNGSIDNFKRIANYATLYNNSIVFISGGNEEEGAAIYTHGKFYANIKEVEDLAADLAALKIIKGVSVDGKNQRIAADHNGIIDFTSDDNSTVSVVGTSTGIKIGLNSAFVKRVTDAEGNITSVSNRVTAIEGTANDASSVNSIPGAKKYAEEKAATAKSEAISDAEGKVNAAKSAVIGANGDGASASTIFGAKKYADEAAAAAKSGAEATASADATSKADTAEQNAKNYADGLKTAIDAAYAKADEDTLAAAKAYADQAELDAIATAGTNADSKISAAIGALKGDKAGEDDHVKVQVVTKGGQVDSVVVTTDDIASAATLAKVKADVDAFFKDALKDGAEQVKDTLKEIQDYINSDVEGAATMAGSIQDAKNAAAAAQGAADTAQGEVDALEGIVAGVKATAEAAATKVALQEEIDRAKGAEQNLQAAINVINGTEAGSISKAVADAKSTIDAYTVNGKAISTNPVLGAADIKVATDKTVAQAISALETAVGEGGSVTTQINSAIDKLDAEITSADGSHVTVKVTEVNGVITAVNVTENDIASAQGLANAVTEIGKKVNKADYDTKVAELEAMWVWEEL